MRHPSELPDQARNKLRDIELQRMSAEDVARAAANRLNGDEADPMMRDQLAREHTRQTSRQRQLSTLISNIQQWLVQLPDVAVLELAPAPNVELKRGESLNVAIAKTRNEIRAARQNLQAVKRAPLPKAFQKKLAAAYVMQLAKPNITITPDGKFGASFDNPNVEGRICIETVLAWLDPDRFVAVLEREIDAMPEAALTLTATERAQRIAELSTHIDQLERSEEALIEAAQAQGIEVARRTDCSPSCVLGVRVVQPNTAAQAA